MAKLLSSNGIEVLQVDFGAQVDALVAFNHSERALTEARSSRVPLERRILILWESEPAWPSQYHDSIHRNYGRVFTLSPVRAQRIKAAPAEAFVHPTPVKSYYPSYNDFLARSNSACIVQANKFSAVQGERYTLRRQTIAHSRRLGIPLAVYGTGWNSGLLHDLRQYAGAVSVAIRARKVPEVGSSRALGVPVKDYRGEFDDKSMAVSQHRISVVIENSDDYVSEKPIDAIRFGTIALYVGPSMLAMGLPANLVWSSEPKSLEICNALKGLMALSPEEQYVIAQAQFQALADVAPWLDERRVVEHLAARIRSILCAP